MTGETLEGLKTEIEEDLEKSMLVQEERIRNNSHLINTVKDGVERNLEDVRDFETKLEDQEKRTTDLVNRVSFNLGGLVSLAVEKGVKNNEAEAVRQRKHIAGIVRMSPSLRLGKVFSFNSQTFVDKTLLSKRFLVFKLLPSEIVK